jgi:hypothetical protein
MGHLIREAVAYYLAAAAAYGAAQDASNGGAPSAVEVDLQDEAPPRRR